jgi:hypothetical protein
MGTPIAPRTWPPGVRSTDPDEGDTSVRVASAEGRHGVLRFVLRRVTGGLYVEREERPRKGTRTNISVQFADREGFKRWCDEDPSRFDTPLLHQRMRRDAEELWELDG